MGNQNSSNLPQAGWDDPTNIALSGFRIGPGYGPRM